MPDDKIACELSDEWRVNADPLQWILCRKSGKVWKTIAYIATYRSILQRRIIEEGGIITPEMQAKLDTMPEHFKGQ